MSWKMTSELKCPDLQWFLQYFGFIIFLQAIEIIMKINLKIQEDELKNWQMMTRKNILKKWHYFCPAPLPQ